MDTPALVCGFLVVIVYAKVRKAVVYVEEKTHAVMARRSRVSLIKVRDPGTNQAYNYT